MNLVYYLLLLPEVLPRKEKNLINLLGLPQNVYVNSRANGGSFMRRIFFIAAISVMIVFLWISVFITGNVCAEEFSDEIQVVRFENDVPLTSSISCIAIGSDGTVAIRSASIEKKGGSIIAVYSKEGVFLYGYWLSMKYENGFPRLFFNSQNELCHYNRCTLDKNHLQDVLLTFHPQRGTYTPQLLEDGSIVLNDNYEYMSRNIYICVRKDSDFLLHQHSDSQVFIRNKFDNTIYKPVDYSAEYNEREKYRNRNRLLFFIGGTCFMVALGFLFSKMKENREGEKNDSPLLDR